MLDLEYFLAGLHDFGSADIAIDFGLVDLMNFVAVCLIGSDKFEFDLVVLAAIGYVVLAEVALAVIDLADFVELDLDFSEAEFEIEFVVVPVVVPVVIPVVVVVENMIVD